jgi:predicted DNA repair protein MutK
MKALSVAGMAAMFLVGGGILTHGVAPLHHWIESAAQALGGVAGTIAPVLADGVVGLAAGAVVLAGVLLAQRLASAGKAKA